ncbi:hypothetical protein KZZ52_47060 [Dactylosporangium sp. AC04546]|uniref:hypothetical protein n=1 Tax=Dactylosporangium sp. AC04546 TaxID=2862460 RepID=UPI001EDEF735|nr:hypothetical protein [Dactylosporangium sp. AC04546]WVK81475.1 hypothetical protein KZZ52_47060 [Dactylosporangium sp. AC04546]
MSPSLPAALAEHTLQQLLDRVPLKEVGAPHRTLRSPMTPDPVGVVRVFQGDGVVERVVTVSLVVPMIHLDSHMVFAFSRADSAVPHFTLDSVYGGEYYAYHLDLIPRAELSPHLSYMDAAYHPLTPLYESASERDGLTRAHISPRQHALMSPWMLVHRASEEAFTGMTPIVTSYLDHWLGLLEGFSPEVLESLADTDLAARDAAVRGNLFSPDVDPVWLQVSRLLGQDASDEIRALLIGEPVA